MSTAAQIDRVTLTIALELLFPEGRVLVEVVPVVACRGLCRLCRWFLRKVNGFLRVGSCTLLLPCEGVQSVEHVLELFALELQYTRACAHRSFAAGDLFHHGHGAHHVGIGSGRGIVLQPLVCRTLLARCHLLELGLLLQGLDLLQAQTRLRC